MIEVGDFGEVLSEDTIHALNLLDKMPEAQCCQLSVHALAGTEDVETLRLRAMVGAQVMLLLVDSGSSHSFVNSAFVSRAGCDITPVNPVRVRVANGQFMSCTSAVKNLSWWYNGTTFSDEMRILDLGGYDAVLGMDWLKKFSPMVSDWANKRLIAPKDGQWITLQGMQLGVQSELLEISPEQLDKCISGNDVWALAILESVMPPDVASKPTAIAPDLQALLSEYGDIFQEPKNLPPHRALDHAITLEQGIPPVNARPYRYSPLHKDEIER